jgi:hypothetical protein
MLHVTEVSVESKTLEDLMKYSIPYLHKRLLELEQAIQEHKDSFPKCLGDATEEDRLLWEVLDEH